MCVLVFSGDFKLRYKPLHDWLEKNHQMRRFSMTRIALGSNGCFWACSDIGYRWNNLPPSMEEVMQKGLHPKGLGKESPTGGALGVDNAWVLTYDNEPPRWSAEVSSYRILWDILSSARECVTVSFGIFT